MIHYTINTGTKVTQELDRVSHGVMTMLRALVTAPVADNFRRHWPPTGSGSTGATVARRSTMFRSQEPLAPSGLAGTQALADEAWPALEELYLGVSDMVTIQGMNSEPVRPASIPWLGVVFMPQTLLTAETDLRWFADFELCLAAVILERS